MLECFLTQLNKTRKSFKKNNIFLLNEKYDEILYEVFFTKKWSEKKNLTRILDDFFL